MTWTLTRKATPGHAAKVLRTADTRHEVLTFGWKELEPGSSPYEAVRQAWQLDDFDEVVVILARAGYEVAHA